MKGIERAAPPQAQESKTMSMTDLILVVDDGDIRVWNGDRNIQIVATDVSDATDGSLWHIHAEWDGDELISDDRQVTEQQLSSGVERVHRQALAELPSA